MSSPVVQIKDIHKIYESGEVPVHAVRGVSLDIQRGEFIALMGASGSGKSTLLHIMGFLDRADSGEYYFAGHPTASLGEGRIASALAPALRARSARRRSAQAAGA